MSRSAAQQVAHWARIGRELEASRSISHRAIAAVLDGRREYDARTEHEQAVVRAEWAERITERREGLDLAQEFESVGRSYVELNQNGNVIRHSATAARPVGT